MIIASKCGRFWALHILVQCAFRYFSCGKRNEKVRGRGNEGARVDIQGEELEGDGRRIKITSQEYQHPTSLGEGPLKSSLTVWKFPAFQSWSPSTKSQS